MSNLGWTADDVHNACYTEDDEEVQYIVERIVLKRTLSSGTEYLIKWKDYPESDNSWEPVANLNCPDLLDEFEKNWAKERELAKAKKAATTKKGSAKGNAKSKAKVNTPILFEGNGYTLGKATNHDNEASDEAMDVNVQPIEAIATTNKSVHTVPIVSTVATPLANTDQPSTATRNTLATSPPPPKKPRIDQIIENEKRREVLAAVERRMREQQERGMPDSASFQRMKARQEAREKAEENVQRAGGFNPVLTWKI